MKIEQLVYDKTLSCFDNLIRNIAFNEHREYRLFYSGAWTLWFNPNGTTVGEKFYIDYFSDYALLKKVHGITLQKINAIQPEKNLKRLLYQYRYVIAFADTYFFEYHENCGKFHGDGDSLLVDDVTDQKVFITDPKYGLQNHPISISQFQKAALGGYGVNLSADCAEPTAEMLQQLLTNKVRKVKNQLKNFTKFRTAFLTMNLEEECKNCKSPWDALIVGQTGRIVVDRYRFLQLLKCLNERYGMEVRQVIDLMEASINDWTILRNNLVRQIYLKKLWRDNNVKRIEKIHRLESCACLKLLFAAVLES